MDGKTSDLIKCFEELYDEISFKISEITVACTQRLRNHVVSHDEGLETAIRQCQSGIRFGLMEVRIRLESLGEPWASNDLVVHWQNIINAMNHLQTTDDLDALLAINDNLLAIFLAQNPSMIAKLELEA